MMRLAVSIIALSIFVGLSTPAIAATINEDISEAETLNSKCQGGSGDNPETERVCAKRDKAYLSLQKRGWCYGHEGQYGYEKTWEKCRKQRLETVSLYLPNKGKYGDSFRIESVTLVAYPERPCHLDELPFYKRMRLATIGRAPVCYVKSGSEILVFSPSIPASSYPDALFAIAEYDESTGMVTISQPGFDYEKAKADYTKSQTEKVMRQLPGARLPERDREFLR